MHKQITRDDRACIYLLLQKGYTNRMIGEELDFHRTTILREVRRNSVNGVYTPRRATKLSRVRKRDSKKHTRRFRREKSLRKEVLRRMTKDHSPEQVSGDMKCISHMTIYRYVDRNPEFKKYLRRGGKRRRRYGTRGTPSRYQKNKRSIHERPQSSQVGVWEGDTIVGKERKLRIITHLEVNTGFLVAKLAGATAEDVYQHVKKDMRKLPCVSITYDNGSEFALHQMIEKSVGAPVYFADPGSPHQRGANENVNGLLRQYFPKGSSFASITDKDVQRAVRKINSRPRKRFNYRTPKELFRCAIEVLI